MNLDKIEADAKRAQERSPGPWRLTKGWGVDGPKTVANAESGIDYVFDSSPKPDGFDDYDGGPWHGNRVVETDGGYYEPKDETAEHIVNCSPDVVLQMVARIRELEAYIADSKSLALDGDTLE